MFFQALIYVTIIFIFCYAMWRLVIKDLLRSKGVKVDEDKIDPLTETQAKRDELRERLEKLKKDATAADDMVGITKEIGALEHEIKLAEQKIKELS